MNERLLFGFIPIYGLLIAIGIALGTFLAVKEQKRLNLPRDLALDLVLCIMPCAIVGARLYYVAFQWDLYKDRLIHILYVWEGGLAIYGGVIAGVLAAFIFSRVRKVPFSVLADMLAPSLILGQAIGRWGNFVNGEAFGYAVTDPALQFFPFAVCVADGWHLATFFYESVWDFAGFLLLWHRRTGIRQSGSLFLSYLAWYGIGRAFIEGLRTDSLMWGSIRVSQALSLLLFVFAVTMLAVRAYRRRKAT